MSEKKDGMVEWNFLNKKAPELLGLAILNSTSLFQHVKVWDLDEATQTWVCTATWKSHFGSVWKVTWAHPEFGQVLPKFSWGQC
jgi:hypothetical protein